MICQDKVDFLYHHYLASQLNVESDIIDVVGMPSLLLLGSVQINISKRLFTRMGEPV